MKQWMGNLRAQRRAFTIVELVIVVAIIGLLAGLLLVGFSSVQNSAYDASVKNDLQKIDDAFKQYGLDNGGVFPNSVNSLSALGIQLTNGSYNTSYLANVYLCTNPTSTEYAVVSMSKSGKRFVVKGEKGISDYGASVVWTSTNASYDATCTSIDASYAPANGGIAAYYGGKWQRWSGLNSLNCPTGFVVVPGNSLFSTSDFCAMKYEAKQASATVPASTAAGVPWVNISQTNAITYSANVADCTGCHLMTEAEWLTIAANVVNVPSNWSSGTVGTGYIYNGHNDNVPASAQAASIDDNSYYTGTGNSSSSGANQRRALSLSNGEVIWDLSGNVFEWTAGTIAGGQQPGASGDGAYSNKEWNDAALIQYGLPANAYPSFATPAASTWSSSAQGISIIRSNHGEATVRGFLRGGMYSSATDAGVYELDLGIAPSGATTSIGFRVTK